MFFLVASQRLVLFVDAQNLYKGARRAFFGHEDSHVCGQFDPIKLGELIASRPSPKSTTTLQQVRMYTGRPESTKEPRTYAAHMKQCSSWERAGAIVIARALRYPATWPDDKPREKGIDVALAIDFVAMAIDGHYDIGVIASTDSDLKPALEYVYRKSGGNRRVEVMNWSSPSSARRLSIPGRNIWCHWLDRTAYDEVADPADYNL